MENDLVAIAACKLEAGATRNVNFGAGRDRLTGPQRLLLSACCTGHTHLNTCGLRGLPVHADRGHRQTLPVGN
jgi:hypothetical protein